MSKTLDEAFDELEGELRYLAEALVDAFDPFTRRMAAVDARLEKTWLGPLLRLLDRVPRWMRFGTAEFFRVFGTLYLITLVVLLIRSLVGP